MSRIQGRKILITGGAGFIGTSLAQKLCDQNQVTIFDNFRRNALLNSPIKNHPHLKVIRGDVLDKKAVDEAVADSEIIVHLASIAGVDTVMREPVQTMKVSILGTYHVLSACYDNISHIERFIDFSSSEVFGRFAYNVNEGDVTSLGAVGEARWTYAVSKLATEHMANNYYKQYGLKTVAIRPFNIFGPNQVGEGAIHHFIKRALANEDLLLHNDGSQIRSWCYIDDILEGILLTLEKQEAVGHTFNIGSPKNTITIYNLALMIKRLTNSAAKIVCIPWDFPDVELRIPDVKKAKVLLGFEAKVDLEEGLLKTIDWYRSAP